MSCATTPAQKRRPFTGQQLPVHTQPFAFRAPQEDDESVKISNTTRSRSSAPSPALTADDATSIVSRRPAPLLQPGRRTSPTSRLQNHQFLFDTNERPQIANHESLLTTHAFLIASAKLLEIELTRSQQTRKHFLIANISSTFAVLAASSRVPRFSAPSIGSQPRRFESLRTHHSSPAARPCTSNRNTPEFRKSATPCKQRRNDFLTATKITTSRYSARLSGVGRSAHFRLPGSRGARRGSRIASCASPIITQHSLIATHESLLTKTRRIP